MQQRIAPSDLCGRLTEPEDHPWSVLALPAEFMAPEVYKLGRLDGIHTTKTGDLLIPKHLTRDVLKAKRIEMGEPAYAAQYLQAPINEANNPIEFEQFKHITSDEFERVRDEAVIIQSWDTVFTAHANSD